MRRLLNLYILLFITKIHTLAIVRYVMSDSAFILDCI